jgi:hypothetical protein
MPGQPVEDAAGDVERVVTAVRDCDPRHRTKVADQGSTLNVLCWRKRNVNVAGFVQAEVRGEPTSGPLCLLSGNDWNEALLTVAVSRNERLLRVETPRSEARAGRSAIGADLPLLERSTNAKDCP